MTTHQPPAPDASRRITVTRGQRGWEVKEERDNEVVRRVTYTDWHRVERAVGFPVPRSTFRVLEPGESPREERETGESD
jgi:hypothetical protein